MDKYCYIVLLLEHKFNNLPLALEQTQTLLRPIELTCHSNTHSGIICIRICQVIPQCYFSNHYVTLLDNISDQVVLPLYMFLFLVIPHFFGLCYGPTIVTIKGNGSICTWYHLKIYKELLKPYNFLCSFRSSHISTSVVQSNAQVCFTLIQ